MVRLYIVIPFQKDEVNFQCQFDVAVQGLRPVGELRDGWRSQAIFPTADGAFVVAGYFFQFSDRPSFLQAYLLERGTNRMCDFFVIIFAHRLPTE